MSSHTRYPDDTDELPAVDASGSPQHRTRPSEQRSSTMPAPEAKEPFKIDLSLSQILGGGLAAATAAAVGSKLGVAGTIGGAAVASVVTAVAASVYTASVRRTKAGVRNVFQRRTTVAEVRDAAPVIRQGTADWATTAATDTLSASTQIERPTPADPRVPPDAPPRVPAVTDADAASGPEPTGGRRFPKLPWKRIALSAVAVFVLASVVIFGFERVTGQALDGQQGTTTFGQVADSGSKSDPSPSSQSSDEPSSEPSDAASTDPSASGEPSSATSGEPSASASGEASSEPSSQPSSQPSASSSQPSSEASAGSSASSEPSTGQSAAAQNEAGQTGANG